MDEERGEAYKNFINSINSDITRQNYERAFAYFMTFCKISNYQGMVSPNPQILEGLIRDYLIHLRYELKLSPGTVEAYLSPIIHFYEMNDVTIKWKKLKKFRAEYYGVVEDKPYNREQIKKIVDAASLRSEERRVGKECRSRWER